MISLDGTGSQTYEELRSGAEFTRTMSNVRSFIGMKVARKLELPKVAVSLIEMKKTKEEIEDFRKMWNIEGVDEIMIKQFSYWDGSIDEINKMALEDIGSKKGYACLELWNSVCILWDGRVVPCCQDYDGKYILGDLNEKSLKEIWNDMPMRMLRKMHLEKKADRLRLCKNCKFERSKKRNIFYPLNRIHRIPLAVKEILNGNK